MVRWRRTRLVLLLNDVMGAVVYIIYTMSNSTVEMSTSALYARWQKIVYSYTILSTLIAPDRHGQ